LSRSFSVRVSLSARSLSRSLDGSSVSGILGKLRTDEASLRDLSSKFCWLRVSLLMLREAFSCWRLWNLCSRSTFFILRRMLSSPASSFLSPRFLRSPSVMILWIRDFRSLFSSTSVDIIQIFLVAPIFNQW